MKPGRLARPGHFVDFEKPLSFRFDGRTFSGLEGDTLASALLANGIRVVGRSFKYHRPRGIVGLGSEEPNALVEAGEGNWREPNTRATQISLYDGLVAKSQNRWPSLSFDVLALNDLLGGILGAGFYYKTFKWPPALWPVYEHCIRKVAGLGVPTSATDIARYDARWHHVDVFVVGAGPAGLTAATAAAQCGARVMLADQESHAGGFLRYEKSNVGGMPGFEWASRAADELSAMPNVEVLRDTTAFGIYDHNFVGAVQRLSAPGRMVGESITQRLWRIRAKQIIIATGAIERPLVLPGNDLPGVMLASATRGYLNGFSIAAGRNVVIVTNNDDAYRTAADLVIAGVTVCAILDSRDQLSDCAKPFRQKVCLGYAASRIIGSSHVRALEARSLSGGPSIKLECDLVCLSGGYTPSVHLYMHAKGKLGWDDDIAGFVPAQPLASIHTAGGCAGRFDLADILEMGTARGIAAAAACGYAPMPITSPATDDSARYGMKPFWQLPPSWPRRGKAFVDLQNDVTEKDVRQAHDEGYVSVEHLKRYTTLGMGTDQGKTSNINGLALMAAAENRLIANVGTTTFRPPFTPVTLSALAAEKVGYDVVPVRRTPLAEVLSQDGAVFVNSGSWRRARYFPKDDETIEAATRREARAVRHHAGITEISTLGKFEISGQGAADLLDHVYATPVRTLAIGRARWALMLREDGMVFDDGTLWRLAEQKYLVTASTANTSAVLSHLEFVRDVVMPHLDVDIACVSEQWAGVALAGPRSRDVLAQFLAAWNIACSTEMAPLDFRQLEADGVPLRIARLSFSGERAYEICVPAGHTARLWRDLREMGPAFGVVPYGIECLELLRIEKGFLSSGHEINGRATPGDLGVQRMLKKNGAYLGAAGLRRAALQAEGRLQLVGLVANEGELSEGAQLVSRKARGETESEGYVTSACYSVSIEANIALALLAGGRGRHGETIVAEDPLRLRSSSVRVVPPIFYDPEGSAISA